MIKTAGRPADRDIALAKRVNQEFDLAVSLYSLAAPTRPPRTARLPLAATFLFDKLERLLTQCCIAIQRRQDVIVSSDSQSLAVQ